MTGFTLGRRIDPGYRTNLWVIIASAAVVIAGRVIFGSLSGGAGLGAGFFLCWALARELDPLHDYSAFVSGGIFLLFFPFYDGIDIGVLFWLLLILRMVSGICGKIPSFIDISSLSGLTVYLAFSGRTSLYMLLLAVAFVMAYGRYKEARKFAFAALFPASVFIILFFCGWEFGGGSVLADHQVPLWLALSAFALPAFSFLHLRKDDSGIVDDLGAPLESGWVLLSILFYMLASLLLAVSGKTALMTLVNLFAAMAGVVIFGLFARIFRSGTKS